jgi:hypothetical protein
MGKTQKRKSIGGDVDGRVSGALYYDAVCNSVYLT